METQPLHGTVVPHFDPKDVKENAIFAALSYVSILSVVMLVAKKDSPFVQEHAKQGVILFIVELVIWILSMAIPGIGWFIIGPLGNLFMLVVSIIGFVKAVQGEFWEVPYIGKYRNKVNF